MNNSATAEAVLRKHGKTFAFARRFLGRKRGAAIARLYSFCRYIDDLADEGDDRRQAESDLLALKHELDMRASRQPFVQDFLELADTWHLDLRHAKDLIDGVLMDLGDVAVADEPELLQYCYHVAGTVGLLMCPLLGSIESGRMFAVDLGIAMQLTNIARDVVDDAKLGRRYLPGDWLENLSAEEICLLRQEDRKSVSRAISRLLSLADEYYESGKIGLAHLPPRSRLAIAIAGKTYRQIGVKLQMNGCKYWQGRVFTTRAEKILLAFAAVGDMFGQVRGRRLIQHRDELHRHIADLLASQQATEVFCSLKKQK